MYSLKSLNRQPASNRRVNIAGLRVSLALAFLFLAALPCHAQLWDMLTNPQITVNLTHPPRLGLNLKKVAFGPAHGSCADEIVDRLSASLLASEVEVTDRHTFSSRLAEKRMSLGESLDSRGAAQMGQLFGPTALVFIKVSRCETERHRTVTERREERKSDSKDNGSKNQQSNSQQNSQSSNSRSGQQSSQQGGNRSSSNSSNSSTNNSNSSGNSGKSNSKNDDDRYMTIHTNHAILEMHLRGTLQTVDLATGRIYSATPIVQDATAENKADEYMPEFPPERTVRDTAIARAAQDARTMYVPWNEQKQLYFFDDKNCNLGQAYAMLKAGDFAGTLRKSLENVEACKTWPKVKDSNMAHAYYNVGLAYLLINDHERALEYLGKSSQLKGGQIVDQTIAETNKSAQLDEEMRRVVERTEEFDQSQAAMDTPAQQQTPASGGQGGSKADSVSDRMMKLDDLYKRGLITKQDYEAKKREILKDL